MTVPQIHDELRSAGKPVSRYTLYSYFKRFKIKPVGVRQCPQRYPGDAAAIIIKRLGLPSKARRNGNTNGKAVAK